MSNNIEFEDFNYNQHDIQKNSLQKQENATILVRNTKANSSNYNFF